MNRHTRFSRIGRLGALVAVTAILPGCWQDNPYRTLHLPPPAALTMNTTAADPYLWLEDVTAAKSLDWVRQQNALSTKELEASPDFAPLRQRLLAILDSKERIPSVAKHGKFYYNYWRDLKNPRGLLRRTSLEEFKKAQPAWETVLDSICSAPLRKRTGSGRARIS